MVSAQKNKNGAKRWTRCQAFAPISTLSTNKSSEERKIVSIVSLLILA